MPTVRRHPNANAASQRITSLCPRLKGGERVHADSRRAAEGKRRGAMPTADARLKGGERGHADSQTPPQRKRRIAAHHIALPAAEGRREGPCRQQTRG